MSSVSVISRLKNILKPLKPTTLIPTDNLAGPFLPVASIKELANELNPEVLAHKFKQRATVSVSFRNRHNIYDFTISRLALAKRYSLIEDILESHKHFEDISHEGFAIRLISLYGKAGMFDHARNLFDEMPKLKCQRTLKSFNALLKAGVQSQRFDDVLKIFREAPSDLEIVCNRVSYNTLIHALCEMGDLDKGLLMLAEMKENGLNPDIITFNTLLDAFYRKKGFDGGEEIWNVMVSHKVVANTRSYNLKMQAMVGSGELRNVVDMFEMFEKGGLKPDVNTFNVLIKGFCDQGNTEEAKKWYSILLENGCIPNRITFNILVKGFCDSGDCELAFDLSKKMFNRQIVVDEALLQLVVNALVKGSMKEEAEELVELGKSNSYVQYSLTMPVHDELAEVADHST